MERLARKRSYTIFFIQNPETARQLHLWRHLKEPSSIGGRQLARKLAIVNWEWDVTLRHDNIKVRLSNYSELSRRPGAARQLHLWRNLQYLSSNRGRQPAAKLATVNWEWDVILQQDNVKVCHPNNLEPSWPPLSSLSLNQLCPKSAFLGSWGQTNNAFCLFPVRPCTIHTRPGQRYNWFLFLSFLTLKKLTSVPFELLTLLSFSLLFIPNRYRYLLFCLCQWTMAKQN